MSTTKNGKHFGHLSDKEESSAKELALVDTLGIHREFIHWEAKLLDAAPVAPFELLSCISLLIKQHRVAQDRF